MEKVTKSNLFPPLVKPEAKKHYRNNWKLSNDGQKVMNELEKRSHYYRQMRNKLFGELFKSGIVTKGGDNDFVQESGEICTACDQRSFLQPAKRHCKNDVKEFTEMKKDNLRHCLCILCRKVLPQTPHDLRQQRTINNNTTTFPDLNVDFVTQDGHRPLEREYYKLQPSRHEELPKDFRISTMDYDSRLVSPQNWPDRERQMPPKDVMLRSERKCQNWLLKNEEYIKRN